MSITIKEAIAQITSIKREKITLEQVGNALETSKQYVGQIREKELKDFQIEKIEKFFNVKLIDNSLQKTIPDNDIIKIPYWAQLPEELKNPDFSCVTAERKAIENHWYSKPENLCIITMIGDALAKYWYTINNGDILIVDTSHNEIRGNGVYFATSRENSRFWVREMQVLINNDVEIKSYAPSGNISKVFNREQLKEVDFRIIGKVIKNVSFKL